MRTSWHGSASCLAGMMDEFLRHKQALGRRFDNEARALRLLDHFLVEQGVPALGQITPALLAAFLASRPRSTPRSFNHLLGVVRRLFDWMVVQGHMERSPVATRPRRETAARRPFLVAPDDLRRLLVIAGGLPDNNRARMRGSSYEVIFTLLSGLGLRVGEVARLRWRDVHFEREMLEIRETKFFKNRFVPYGPKVAARLTAYRQAREASLGSLSPDDAVFSFTPGRTIHPNTIGQTFRSLLPELDLTRPLGTASPTVHCLRHSFAVRTLLHWYREGVDPSSRLLHLATFLGHVSISSTAVYLTITQELLDEAGRRFERLARPLLTETDR